MDLLTARNGAPPPPVQTKSTRNEGRKRSFWRWQRRALKAARDHEGREAAEAVQAAERNQQRAAQRRAKAAALDRKTAARHRRHRDCLLKQIKKGARLLNQQKEKRAAEERRKCRRQQHEEMLQRAAERKRRRRERHNLTAALAQRRHWRLGLKMLLLLVIFAAYLECAAAMPRGNVAAAAAGAGQRKKPAHVYCTRTNIPLMLAFAKTIHKRRPAALTHAGIRYGRRLAALARPHAGAINTGIPRSCRECSGALLRCVNNFDKVSFDLLNRRGGPPRSVPLTLSGAESSL